MTTANSLSTKRCVHRSLIDSVSGLLSRLWARGSLSRDGFMRQSFIRGCLAGGEDGYKTLVRVIIGMTKTTTTSRHVIPGKTLAFKRQAEALLLDSSFIQDVEAALAERASPRTPKAAPKSPVKIEATPEEKALAEAVAEKMRSLKTWASEREINGIRGGLIEGKYKIIIQWFLSIVLEKNPQWRMVDDGLKKEQEEAVVKMLLNGGGFVELANAQFPEINGGLAVDNPQDPEEVAAEIRRGVSGYSKLTDGIQVCAILCFFCVRLRRLTLGELWRASCGFGAS